MPSSPHINIRIDLEQVRRNARAIRELTNAAVLAVIKADAYGVGAARIAPAIADIVDGFCVFSLAEAAAAELWQRTGKICLVLGPDDDAGADDYLAQHARPAVWEVERATKLRRARPVLSVDTGMQRFACPAAQLDAVLAAGGCDEAFTHATSLDRVQLLLERVGGRGLRLHAAGSSLLHEPSARLDAVRPGLALYQGAVRVSTRLIDTRKSDGPVGYSGFAASHHGVIRAGYFNGLRPGPCLVNGRRSRVIEVGMQTAFVETCAADMVGDEVVLLGDSLSETEIAAEWKTSPHEALTRLAGTGIREYVG
jgi:alanine racemase